MKRQSIVLWLFITIIFVVIVVVISTKNKVDPDKGGSVASSDQETNIKTRDRSNPTKRSSGPVENNPSEQWRAAFQSPINFWGKVVDQDGVPVQGATIGFIVTDDPSWSLDGGSNSKYEVITDTNGRFELLEKRGAGIMVEASAFGYVPMYGGEIGTNLSRASISYIGQDDNMRNPRPTKNSPTILILRKKNQLANLSYLTRERVQLFKDGRPSTITLKEKGKSITVEVRCWSSAPDPFSYDRYDWRAEIQVVGSQIKPITETNPIEAPENGYLTKYEIDMTSNMKGNWMRTNPAESKNFWVKLEDGSYAKLEVSISTGRKHQVNVKSWLNLDGNRNFEQ